MEFASYLRFILALIVVLGLIGFFAWLAKRFGMAPRVRGGGGGKRLRIVEVAAVDAKRRLLLVRRDDTEHLILLGPANDLVLESGIAVAKSDVATPVDVGQARTGGPA